MSRSLLVRTLLRRQSPSFYGSNGVLASCNGSSVVPRWLSMETSSSSYPMERSKPSVLSALTEEDSASKAWSILLEEYKGGFPVRHADVRDIFDRTATEDDAKLIKEMLTVLKNNHRFILLSEEAHMAMKIMNKNNNKNNNSSDEDSSLERHLFVAKTFLDKHNNGLYYSATVDSIEELILQPMLESLQQHSEEASKLALQIIHTLLFRGSQPYQRMKKRAARKYLRHLECPVGPYPTTLHLALQIILFQNPSNHIHADKLLHKFTDTRRTPLPESIALIQQAKQQEADDTLAAQQSEDDNNEEEETDNGHDETSQDTQK